MGVDHSPARVEDDDRVSVDLARPAEPRRLALEAELEDGDPFVAPTRALGERIYGLEVVARLDDQARAVGREQRELRAREVGAHSLTT